MPLATQLDKSFDDDDLAASSDNAERFSRVPLIPDTRFSSKFASENAEDLSEEEEENTQELRDPWEEDQRKMKSIFTNDELQQPIDGVSDDSEVSDLSPRHDNMTEDARLSRDDSKRKPVERPGRRISRPLDDVTNRRPVTDRKRRDSELSYNDEEDDDDERYKHTTTTTTATTTTTRDTTKRMTKSEDDVEMRRPRARSSEGNLISVSRLSTSQLLADLGTCSVFAHWFTYLRHNQFKVFVLRLSWQKLSKRLNISQEL